MSILTSYEVSINHLDDFANHMDYDFALAHLVTKNEKYRDYFKKQCEKRLVILDNSFFELGHPIPSDELAEICKMINAQEIVAPDYLNVERTVNAAYEMQKSLNKAGLKKTKILAVVQGRSLEEWTSCHNQLIRLPFVSKLCICFNPLFKLGVPKECMLSPTKSWMWTRINFMKHLNANGLMNHNKTYHLLGLADGRELFYQKAIPKIVTNDSSSPYVHGKNSIRYTEDGLPCEKIKEKVDFDEVVDISKFEDIVYNMELLRTWSR